MAIFNFTQQQQASRRTSALLVTLFVVMVMAISAIVGLIASVLLASPQYGETGQLDVDLQILVVGTAAVMAAILATSLFKLWSLGGDGAKVARSLGGEEVSATTQNPALKRYFNVVEEVAIAAGVPRPRVFVIKHEHGINAFAAGSRPDRAAVGMTHGAVSLLTRSEMAGVVAHEMAHVVNRDTRLNIRLLAMVFGLVVLSTVGHSVIRNSIISGRGNRDSKAVLAAVLIGVSLIVLGFLGTIGGRLLQSAVSRRREYLADATAVEFTRDPEGLAGALKKIAGLPAGSRVGNAHAEEARHMFFADAGRSFAGLLDTHPPLLDRIRALDPHFVAKPSAPPRLAERDALRDSRSEFRGPWGSATKPGEERAW